MLLRLYNPFAGHLFFFLLGTACYSCYQPPTAMVYGLVISLTVGYTLLACYQAYSYSRYRSTTLGIIGCLTMVSIGALRTMQVDVWHTPDHLLHRTPQGCRGYLGTIVAHTKVGPKVAYTQLALQACASQGQWQPTTGRVRLMWPKQERLAWQYGDQVIVFGSPKQCGPTQETLQEASYPVSTKTCCHQHKVVQVQVAVIGHSHSQLMEKVLWARQHLKAYICHTVDDQVTQGMLMALLLGMREGLTKELQTQYSHAGVAHVLAVSGLHIGLLYWLLAWILALLCTLVRRRHSAKAGTLLGIASYAVLAGLGPSVVRAASMVALTTWARLAKRIHGVIEGLAITAFFMLCYDPFVIYEVGFLLSYNAVLGIVMLAPPANEEQGNYLQRVCHWLYKMGILSLGAQLATAPLTLYYFHTFPTYFIISNYVMIPMTALLLTVALVALACAPLPYIGGVGVKLLQATVQCNHFLVGQLASLPYAILGPFYPTWWEVTLMYGIIASTYLLLTTRQFRYVAVLLLVSSSLITILL